MIPGAAAGLGVRIARAVAAAAGVLAASTAVAQQWLVYTGAAGRVEYNDNYFFTAPGQTASGNPNSTVDPESAMTLSLVPFVTASRRTEDSEVTALLTIGGNAVWGPSLSDDYLTGRFALDGTLREGRGTWRGRTSYYRDSSLAQAISGAGVQLVRAYVDTGVLEGSYDYLMTDRWTIGATAGGYGNWYDTVQGAGATQDDWGYNVNGRLGYVYSDQARLNYTLGYTYYASDITRSSVLTTTVGVVYRFSPQLTVSGSVGGFWSDTTARQTLPGQGPSINAGEARNDSGTLFGGSVVYELSQSTRFDARASEGLAPSSIGAVSKDTNASVALSHRFSDRLTGRLGARYLRITYPGAPTDVADEQTIRAGAGLSYQFAERWILEAGYQYTRARYGQNPQEPRSNVVSISIGYNWPGDSFTGWVGIPADTLSLPGAGPLALPGPTGGESGLPAATIPSESSPFDGLTLP